MGTGYRNVRNPGRTKSQARQRQYRREQFFRDDYDRFVDEHNRRDYDEYRENSANARVIYNDYPDRNYTQRYNEEHEDNRREMGRDYVSYERNENPRRRNDSYYEREENFAGRTERGNEDFSSHRDERENYDPWGRRTFGVRANGTTGGTRIDSRGFREDLEEFDDEWNEYNVRDENDEEEPRRRREEDYDEVPARREEPRRYREIRQSEESPASDRFHKRRVRRLRRF